MNEGNFETKSMNGSDSSYAVIMIATDMVSFVKEDKPEAIERSKSAESDSINGCCVR